MLRRNRKTISILLTLTMLAALLLPMATPAFAQSVNSVSRVLAVDDEYTGAAADLTVKEDSDFQGQFTGGQTFRITLTPGVDWLSARTAVYATYGGVENQLALNTNYFFRTDNVMEVTMPNEFTAENAATNSIRVTMGIDVDGYSGEIKATVDPMDSTVTGGSYTFAIVKGGNSTAVAEEVKKIGETGTGGVIRIDETAVGSLGDGQESVTLKLPSNFVWDNTMGVDDITFAGGFANTVPAITAGTGAGEQNLTFTFTPPAGPRAQRGTIYVTPQIKAKNSANYGEVSVSISSSTDVDDADVVVAEYVDWGVTVKVAEVKELLAGKFDDVKTAKITIEENVSGSLLNGRDLTVELPDWVKVTDIMEFSATDELNGTAQPTVSASGDIDGDNNDFDIRIANSNGTKGKIEFKLALSIEGNKSGDITANLKGAGIEATELVVAKAVAPALAKVENVKEVKIGVQGQEVNDIVITEGIKEAFEKNPEITTDTTNGVITLTLPEGVKFATTPKAEIVEGNLDIKEAEVKLTNDDKVLEIPVDSESTKAGSIKVSGIKLTVDRTYPEGEILVKVGGNAVIENYYTSAGYRDGSVLGASTNTALEAGEFNTATAVKVKVAECVTPAPGEAKQNATFTLGSTSYTVAGVEYTMDVAPYAKNGRTYLPVRYVAKALGVDEENILFANGVVTLLKGDKAVQMTIGSKNLVINGVTVTMDVPAEITDGRTMLPFRWMAQAFGAKVSYDETTKVVSMEQ